MSLLSGCVPFNRGTLFSERSKDSILSQTIKRLMMSTGHFCFTATARGVDLAYKYGDVT